VPVLSTSEWELVLFQGRYRRYRVFATTFDSNRIFSGASERAQFSVVETEKTEKLGIVTLVLINKNCSDDFRLKVTSLRRRHFVYSIFVIFPLGKLFKHRFVEN
jgi:hypothetical protein